ncbi:tyrosine-type recombinase/integrase [[Clostridium] innocuum]|uniref:tyrosine-type recombinase/integrase n=1 Tax=Clostridium innocuum TaxID=1522 RepID=UPI001C37FFDE|nr:tyrosine-type recombinase/integrase [[Clostridium] innocuum]MBV4170958.1 tyrosine-type recombinase/integrase [[Clostridium] innocuum]
MKRRPKGYGSIYKLSGERSCPYGVFITYGRDEKGKQIQKPIGYAETPEKAENILLMHHMQQLGFIPQVVLDNAKLEGKYIAFLHEMMNQNILPPDPRKITNIDTVNSLFESRLTDADLSPSQIKQHTYITNIKTAPTFSDIWFHLLDTALQKLTASSLTNYTTSYNRFKLVHNTPIDKIKLDYLQSVFDDLMYAEGGCGYSKMNNMKIVLNYIFRYAEEREYILRNPAKFVHFHDTLDESKKKPKGIFTNSQIAQLVQEDTNTAVFELVCIYTGMRPGEVLKMQKANVHLDEHYMIGGSKTKAGIDRVIPIHDFLLPYIERLMQQNDDPHLFTFNGNHISYTGWLDKHYNTMKEKLKFDSTLTPHSGRHTFSTLAKECGMDEFYRKCIMGHAHGDITNDVYTKARIEKLLEEVNKIKVDGVN